MTAHATRVSVVVLPNLCVPKHETRKANQRERNETRRFFAYNLNVGRFASSLPL
jgi:hypothetical protein